MQDKEINSLYLNRLQRLWEKNIIFHVSVVVFVKLQLQVQFFVSLSSNNFFFLKKNFFFLFFHFNKDVFRVDDEGNLLCKEDWLIQNGMICSICQDLIPGDYVTIDNNHYHPTCLICHVRYYCFFFFFFSNFFKL